MKNLPVKIIKKNPSTQPPRWLTAERQTAPPPCSILKDIWVKIKERKEPERGCQTFSKINFPQQSGYFICRDSLTEIPVRQLSFTFAVFESAALIKHKRSDDDDDDEPSVSWMLIRFASFLPSPVYNSALLAVSPPTAASFSHVFLYLSTAERRLLQTAVACFTRYPPPCCKPSPPICAEL